MRLQAGRATILGVGPTVLIVDDHPEFRRLARALLEAERFEVVGEAADGESAIAESLRLQPDVVLLDIQLPDLDGFEVATRLAAAGAPSRVVLTSSRSRSAFRRRLESSPALGFIPKDELSGQTLAAFAG
jgi:DNA-binding NarL/FixJ family response regulator